MKASRKLIFMIAMAAVAVSCKNKDEISDATGIFEATEIMIAAKSSGEIREFNIEEGMTVKPDMALGYIDTTQSWLKKVQLYAAQSANDSRALNESQQLASLRQQIENVKKEKARFEELLKADAATQKQVDDINYQIGVMEKQLIASSEQIGSANSSVGGQSAGITAQIAQLDDLIKNSIIKSPIEGVILTKYAQNGEFAAPGRVLFRVGNIEDMKLRAYISADQLSAIKIGQKVKVYADQGKSDKKEYEGTIIWISEKAEFTPKTIQTRDERANLVYAIKVLVKNDGLIKKGMYGEVKF
jgi:HlyD family secretion protein